MWPRAMKKQSQNKPNFRKAKMNASIATIKDYDNEQRTINNERYSKQSQTKPIWTKTYSNLIAQRVDKSRDNRQI